MHVKNFVVLKEDLDGWNGQSPVFAELINEVKPSTIIEVGTWKGQSAITMAEASGPATKIYCVDTWEGASEFKLNEKMYGDRWSTKNVYEKFISNCIHHRVLDKIEVVRAKSSEAIVPLAKLIYIDGEHSYDGVMEDLVKYWDQVMPGGIMFGDDYNLVVAKGRPDGYMCGVKEAVNDFVVERNLKLEIRYGNFWIIRKTC